MLLTNMNKTNYFIFGAAAILAGLAGGCSSPPQGPTPVAFVEQGIAGTAPARAGLLGKDSSAEQQAIEQFKKFNSDFSKANITANAKNVYDPEIYFIDPFKDIHGEAEFEAYLLRSADSITQYSMEWKDVAENEGNYYFRWIMTIKRKSDGKDAPASRITGISHVRFGRDGKVIFHQDYFDAGAFLYENMMGVGTMIRNAKSKM
jgi:limonene-1,2-epoxide hydrolase